MFRRMITIMVLAGALLVVGCQNDTEITVRNSARVLRKGEGYESRQANPYAGNWTWGNQQGMN